MASIPESVSTRPTALDRIKLTREKAIAGVLGAVATVGTIGQYSDYYWGYGVKAPDIVEAAMNSSGHPLVGFIGAASAIALADRSNKKASIMHRFRRRALRENVKVGRLTTSRALLAIQGGAIANFYVESAQVIARQPIEESLFWNTPRETVKDYFFALAGAGLYATINNRKSKKV